MKQERNEIKHKGNAVSYLRKYLEEMKEISQDPSKECTPKGMVAREIFRENANKLPIRNWLNEEKPPVALLEHLYVFAKTYLEVTNYPSKPQLVNEVANVMTMLMINRIHAHAIEVTNHKFPQKKELGLHDPPTMDTFLYLAEKLKSNLVTRIYKNESKEESENNPIYNIVERFLVNLSNDVIKNKKDIHSDSIELISREHTIGLDFPAGIREFAKSSGTEAVPFEVFDQYIEENLLIPFRAQHPEESSIFVEYLDHLKSLREKATNSTKNYELQSNLFDFIILLRHGYFDETYDQIHSDIYGAILPEDAVTMSRLASRYARARSKFVGWYDRKRYVNAKLDAYAEGRLKTKQRSNFSVVIRRLARMNF